MNVQLETALILNLRAAAQWHKEHCHENCAVSLFQLYGAAQLLETRLKNKVIPDAEREIIDGCLMTMRELN